MRSFRHSLNFLIKCYFRNDFRCVKSNRQRSTFSKYFYELHWIASYVHLRKFQSYIYEFLIQFMYASSILLPVKVSNVVQINSSLLSLGFALFFAKNQHTSHLMNCQMDVGWRKNKQLSKSFLSATEDWIDDENYSS
jgi:hypothetical protein